jgi:hypothetical protein
MTAKKTVWVLTYETNDYDQHGEYFKAVFAEKPAIGKLADTMRGCGGLPDHDVMGAVAFLEHLLAGGGRRGEEHTWYNLSEEPLL